jgi:hypothetical protein
MFEMQGGFRVMHWHGGDDWVPMSESSEHSSASHDPERAWLKGARIFKCTSCEESIAITAADPRDTGDADHPHPGV